jgi:transposase-like protein
VRLSASQADRNLSDTASVWGAQVEYDTITIVVKQFWPDIRRQIYRKKKA